MNIDKSMDNQPQISYQPDGPYNVLNVETVTDIVGENIVSAKLTLLCRCGSSKKMPCCDGAHLIKPFINSRGKSRLPDRRINYRGKNILIHFNPAYCSHDGTCLRSLPKVFSQSQNPWINPDAATPEKIIEIINLCPSGALSYTIDNIRYSELERNASIKTVKYGSLEVKGKIKLIDPEKGELKPESLEHYSLCRCGLSSNTPFCDGSHFASEMDE